MNVQISLVNRTFCHTWENAYMVCIMCKLFRTGEQIAVLTRAAMAWFSFSLHSYERAWYRLWCLNLLRDSNCFAVLAFLDAVYFYFCRFRTMDSNHCELNRWFFKRWISKQLLWLGKVVFVFPFILYACSRVRAQNILVLVLLVFQFRWLLCGNHEFDIISPSVVSFMWQASLLGSKTV